MSNERLRKLYQKLNADGPGVSLTVCDNRVRMASVRFPPQGPARMRLHHAFENAPQHVHDALIRYIQKRDDRDWAAVRAFAGTIQPAVPGPAACLVALRPEGEVYNLREIYDEVNASFFEGRITCRITWGRQQRRRRGKRKSIHFGTWNPQARVIRIHPGLDSQTVPREFIRFIVYHELLHAELPPSQSKNGRAIIHSKAYRALEQRFPHCAAMKALGRDLLRRIP